MYLRLLFLAHGAFLRIRTLAILSIACITELFYKRGLLRANATFKFALNATDCYKLN